MTKLLSASFSRLWKNRVFWLCAGGMLLLSLGLMFAVIYSAQVAGTGTVTPAAQEVFAISPIVAGLASAVFTGLFLGTEHSDGGLTNKLIVGHNRISIYLSHFLVNLAAGLLMLAVGILGILIPSIILLGGLPQGDASLALPYGLISAAVVLSYTGIYTLLGMLIQSRAGLAVITLLVFMGLAITSIYCDMMLREEEYYHFDYEGVTVVIDGNLAELEDLLDAEPVPNPSYVSGFRRTVYTFIYDFLPTGQALQVMRAEAPLSWRLPLFSLLIAAVTTGAGLMGFRRKDLT